MAVHVEWSKNIGFQLSIEKVGKMKDKFRIKTYLKMIVRDSSHFINEERS
jgi:hypothetical protein